MGTVVAFRDRESCDRRDAGRKPRKWICREDDYCKDLSRAVRMRGAWGTEEADDRVRALLEEGLQADYNLELKAKCGMADSDVEIEVIPGEDGRFYYAVYTDEEAAGRSSRAGYYTTGYKISMHYLISQIKDEDYMGGICINPYSGNRFLIPRRNLQEVYEACIG